ncbi:MAG: hypothetical protein QNJ16_13085 [Rhodobacter sp.]|nr:hypothetical protein [Rhodobacter sp.]
MRFVRFFLWVVPLAVVLLLWNGAGSLYVIRNYEFLNNGDPYNPFATRYYTSCTFTNFRDTVTVPARGGRCGWIRVFWAGGAS